MYTQALADAYMFTPSHITHTHKYKSMCVQIYSEIGTLLKLTSAYTHTQIDIHLHTHTHTRTHIHTRTNNTTHIHRPTQRQTHKEHSHKFKNGRF